MYKSTADVSQFKRRLNTFPSNALTTRQIGGKKINWLTFALLKSFNDPLPSSWSMEKRRDLCFACTQSQKSLNVCVWDVQNGVALRTFSCDGGHSGSQLSSNAAALCLLKEGHLLCAPKNLPYIYVWNLTKVSSRI